MPPKLRSRPGRKILPIPKQAAPAGSAAETHTCSKDTPAEPFKSITGLQPLEGPFNPGEFIPYPPQHHMRTAFTQEELDERDAPSEVELAKYRKAAEAHRQARKWAKANAKPGIKLIDYVRGIENRALDLLGPGHVGLAFPCGVSINECAAHYTPLPGDDRVLRKGDVMKVDFGTHVDGFLIDSAFTVHFDDKFDSLSDASHEATNAAIKNAGPDMSLDELGGIIEEIISSHEVEIDGKTYKCKPVRNLSGHQVAPYHVHAGKSVPLCHGSGDHNRMKEGETYAIETFASTGHGCVNDSGEASHWMLSSEGAHAMPAGIRQTSARTLLSAIQHRQSTLAFTQRWFIDAGLENVDTGLHFLWQKRLVDDYPPLSDVKGSYVSQFEHTIRIKASGVEVLSRGSDY